MCRHSASIHHNKTPRFPNVTAGTKKLAAECHDEVNDRVSTISLQCNSHVQHGAEQHVLLHDVSSEAESCPTQTGMKVAVTVEVSGISTMLARRPNPVQGSRDRIPRKSIQSTRIRHRCRISTSRETTTTQARSRDDDRSSYHVNSELTSPLVWPSWNTYHRGTDIRISFECVVTPNVRQRLEERDVPCIVVDVRSRTKNAQTKSAVKRKRPSEQS